MLTRLTIGDILFVYTYIQAEDLVATPKIHLGLVFLLI